MMQAWNIWLAQRSRREQLGIQSAMALLTVWLVWSLAVAPAWQVLRRSDAERERLNQQTTQMQAWQQQAQLLRQQAPVPPEQAAQTLQNLGHALDSQASFKRQGATVSLNFKGASPAALAEFLAQARSTAHSQVIEAHWQQSNGAWSGQLVLQLPVLR